MNTLLNRFKENLLSVLPIVAIVLILHFSLVPLNSLVLSKFLIGSFLIVLGLTLFIIGVDTGISPIGNKIGSELTKSNKLLLIIATGLILGIIITVAEPSLIILANQIDLLTASLLSSKSIIIAVSIGTSIMLALGLVRIVYKVQLKYFFLAFYTLALIFAILSSTDFLALAFDASGATTGALAVPFILAIAIGTSSLNKDSQDGESDSFGLVGVASIGAILAVLFMGLNKTGSLDGQINLEESSSTGILAPFLNGFLTQALQVFVALLPIIVLFLLANYFSFKVKRHEFLRILIGLLLACFGLSLFLLGVNEGFMEVGSLVGAGLAKTGKHPLIILIAFILGVVTILAEPAVHILTKQIEEVTSGYVKKNTVMLSLATGVGIALSLSVLRIMIPALNLWHIILPGYLISIISMFFAPSLFVGIAFDSGGVASGPMTATFVLAFTQGIAMQTEGANVILDGFGVISLVAMIPLISLQILGIIYSVKSKKRLEEEVASD